MFKERDFIKKKNEDGNCNLIRRENRNDGFNKEIQKEKYEIRAIWNGIQDIYNFNF